jgi:hypothetical protein
MLAALLCNPLVRTLRVQRITRLRNKMLYVQSDWAEVWVYNVGP